MKKENIKQGREVLWACLCSRLLSSLLVLIIIISGSVSAHAQNVQNEVIIFDGEMPEVQSLVAGVKAGVKIVYFDPSKPMIQSVAEAVQSYSPVKALHIVTHGEQATLGTSYGQINVQVLNENNSLLSNMQSYLANDAIIYLYGCNVAGSTDGKSFVDLFAAKTGADVVASTGLTGNSALGGNWDFEYATTPVIINHCISESARTSYPSTLQKVFMYGEATRMSLANHYALRDAYTNSGFTCTYMQTGTIPDLSDYDLVWIIQPNRAITSTEIARLKAHLEKGGRIVMMGEHGGYSPTQNNNISAAVLALGAHFSIVNQSLCSLPACGQNQKASGIMADHPLTANVTTFQSNFLAPIAMGGAAEVLMKAPCDQSKIFMAIEKISNGDIVMWADQNWWDDGTRTSTCNQNMTFVLNLATNAHQNVVNTSLAVLSTTPAYSISGNSAMSGGNITDDKGNPITQRGICWSSSSQTPTTADSKVFDATGGTGLYNAQLTGLSLNTTYYVRAFAINENGTAYGNTINFKTPAVQNISPTAVADNFTVQRSTSFNGNVQLNDYDGDNDPMTAVLVTAPSYNNGTFILNANGTFTYTHNGNAAPADFFSYYLTDGKSNSSTVGVSISVFTPTTPPTSANGFVTTNTSGTYSFKASDFAYNSASSSPFNGITVTSLPSKGVLKYNGQVIAAGAVCNNVANLSYDINGATGPNPFSSFNFKVLDGSGQPSTSAYTMTINSGMITNTAPTISAIGNQATCESTASSSIGFVIDDAESVASDLTLSASSSNTGVVPISGILFGGTGANRTVIVTPASGMSGQSTITITVADPGAMTSQTDFIFTVTAAPIISDANVNIQEYTSADDCKKAVTYPVTVSGNAIVTYTLSGATTGSGSGTGSGAIFNKGLTHVKITAVKGSCPETTAEFDVTIEDKVAPLVHTQNITVQLDENGQATISPSQINNGSTDACGIPANGYALDKSTFDCSNVGTNTVTLTVTDVNGNVASKTAIVTVEDKIMPVVNTKEATLYLSAAGSATLMVTDVFQSASDNCTVAPNGYSLSKTTFDCTNVGLNTVTLTATDANGNTGSTTAIVNVIDNTKPVITHNDNKSVNNDAAKCGASVSVSATAVDNCSAGTPVGVRSDGLALAADYPVGTTTITWNVTDINGNPATATQTVTISNAVPVITSVTAPLDPIAIKTAINLGVTYTDNNVTNAAINWGDGTAVQNVANPANTFSTPHTYTAAGVYTLKVTLTDACNSSSTEYVHQYVVVYDPSAGFITGGGWINSPEGAYTADQTLIGKANFGFVSKYQKGSTVPTGNTQFEFHAGNLNFKSISYEWLVISGPRGQFKGKGTINGLGDYGFLLSGVDGQISGGGGVDKFRIKIWDRTTDAVVYDNQPSAAEDAEASTPLGGGSIVIHTASKGNVTTTAGANIIEEGAYDGKLTVAALPNPSRNLFTLKAQSGSTQSMQVTIMDVLGRTIETKRNISANTTLSFGNNYRPGVYYVEVVQGAEKQILKLVKQ